MSVKDPGKHLDAVVSDFKAHVTSGSDSLDFQPLTKEEQELFFGSSDSEGRQLLAECPGEATDSTDSTDSIEENEVFLVSGLSFPPHAGVSQSQESKSQQPYALRMEPSSCRVTTTRSLELCPSRGVTHVQGRSAVARFVFLAVSSAIVAVLFVNFYHLLRAGISQSDLLKSSRPNPIQFPTATPPPARDTTSPPMLAPPAQTQSEAKAQPAAQAPAKVEPAVQATPQIPAKVEDAVRAAPEVHEKIGPAAQSEPQVPARVEPAARAARAQAPARKKRSYQQRVAQSTEPPWSRDADSFIRYLFFGRVD
jgi:hypothetical protein